MTPTPILQQLQGPFSFLRQNDPEEIRRLLGNLRRRLPRPVRIFLEDEAATPRLGFPVLLSEEVQALREALVQYLLREELLQASIVRRQPSDRKAYAQAWEAYQQGLVRVVENTTLSSYGRKYPTVFWLYHSLDVAALFRETPRRVSRMDTELGRQHGDSIKYRVYERWSDQVRTTVYDTVQKLATSMEEEEDELFPALLLRMIDNVLIFTEDHVSPNLGELSSYFSGSLRIDGRALRQRLDELAVWHQEALAQDETLRRASAHLLGADPAHPRDLLVRPGYLSFLVGRPSYDHQRLPTGSQVAVWESLLVKLKEFELFQGLRRLMVPVEREPGGAYVCRRASLNRTMVGRQDLRLSATTRPMDFTAPWVVDPLVHRIGMIYDIAEFSRVVSVLKRSGTDLQDDSFRKMFRFQRRVNQVAQSHRLQLEKYLGDGAFFSSRDPRASLIGSIHVQRLYRQALEEDFPFDRGMRIALNWGQYRLIPIHTEQEGAERYEFFGHGLVELSRLTTGKATREIEEIRTMMVNLGYPEETVRKFFSPLLQQNVDTVDKREEERPFYAYINQNGNLVNEGLVATAAFIEQLDRAGRFAELYRVRDDADRRYVGLPLDDDGTPLLVGLRKLGIASLKGLDRMAIFEVVDFGARSTGLLDPLHGPGLMAAIEREFAAPLGASAPPGGPSAGSTGGPSGGSGGSDSSGGPAGEGSGSGSFDGSSSFGTRPLGPGLSRSSS